MSLGGFIYQIDIVMCIDCTGSMAHLIGDVKANALRFYDDLVRTMTRKQKKIDRLRVKVIAFRDYYVDGPNSMLISGFFNLPDQNKSFAEFINNLRADGGGDDPETSLEALALAIKSDWLWGLKSRQLIVLWTDTTAHPLERDLKAKPANYPPGIPQDFNALTDLWGDQNYVDSDAKRLVLYAPEAPPWPNIAEHWDNVVHYPSQAGRGLEEMEYNEILEHIAESL
jgi:hypothetical protein